MTAKRSPNWFRLLSNRGTTTNKRHSLPKCFSSAHQLNASRHGHDESSDRDELLAWLTGANAQVEAVINAVRGRDHRAASRRRLNSGVKRGAGVHANRPSGSRRPDQPGRGRPRDRAFTSCAASMSSPACNVTSAGGSGPMIHSRRSSIGGAANAAGETFRADVAARIAVHVLAQRPIRDVGPSNIPRRMRLESGSEADDIEVTMAEGGTAWIQAKRRLELSVDRQKPLAKAFDQLVRQYVRTPGLDSSRDRLVLAYESSSGPIAVLRTVTRRFCGDCPTRTQAAPDAQDQKVLEKLEQIVATAWRDVGGTSPDWLQLSRFLSFVVFWELRAGDDGRVEVDPSHLLASVVENEGTGAAAKVLRDFAYTLAQGRRGATVSGLREALRDAGIALRDTEGLEQRIELHLATCRSASSLAAFRAVKSASLRPFGGGVEAGAKGRQCRSGGARDHCSIVS